MGHYVDAGQLAELCQVLGFEDEEQQLISAATAAARLIAEKLDVNLKEVENVPGFAGLCANFCPKYEGQPIPDLLKHYDMSSDWVGD